MPTPPKNRAAKAARALAVQPAPPKPTGVFARLKAEAEADLPPVEPYVIDDVDPPIVIPPPDDADTQLELSELFGEDGEFQMRDARRILRLICGDAFDRVMEQFGKEHITVLLRLIGDMGRHFQEQAPAASPDGAADFPGGTPASSS